MPQGQFPTILAGQDYTASLLQSMVPYFGWKVSGTSYSSTTLTADADLQIQDLPANAFFDVKATIFYSAAASGDPGLKGQFYAPSGSTALLVTMSNIVAGETPSGVTATLAGSFDLHCGVASTTTAALLEGSLFTGSASGTAGLEFAENTSGDPVTVMANSILKLTRMD